MESSIRSRHPHRHWRPYSYHSRKNFRCFSFPVLLAIYLFLLFYLIGLLVFPTFSFLVFSRLSTFLSYCPSLFSFFFSVFPNRFNSLDVLIFVGADNSSSISSFSSSSFFHDPSNLTIFLSSTSSAAFSSSPSASHDFSFPSSFPPPPHSFPSSMPHQNTSLTLDDSRLLNTFVTFSQQFAPPRGLSSSEISGVVLSNSSSSSSLPSSLELLLFSTFESLSNRQPRCLTTNFATPAPDDPSQDVTTDRIWTTFKSNPGWYMVILWYIIHSFAGCCFCCWLCTQRSYQKSLTVSP